MVADGYKPVDDFRRGLEACYYYIVWKQTMDGSNTSGIYSSGKEYRGKRNPYARYEVWLKAGLLLGLPAECLLEV